VRIIAGTAGGLRLTVPRRGVRPTMDRVKAAIFSSLGQRIAGARVLDLFAGAGGLGIEALSRGAVSALFVESNREAAGAIERNIVAARLTANVRRQDVFEFLRHARGEFDVIFADPPYERTAKGESFIDLLLNNRAVLRLLAAGGVFVLEKRPDELVTVTPNWTPLRWRRYGATEVLFLTHARP
jgi:16S rRNA (guanine966-N2)-methyltransferase